MLRRRGVKFDNWMIHLALRNEGHGALMIRRSRIGMQLVVKGWGNSDNFEREEKQQHQDRRHGAAY